MPTHRLLPPGALPGLPSAPTTVVVNGRTYTQAPGGALDVSDGDSPAMIALGWVFVAESGPTSARPSFATNPSSQYPLEPGLVPKFYDTTLGFLIFWDGAAWRDPTGTAR